VPKNVSEAAWLARRVGSCQRISDVGRRWRELASNRLLTSSLAGQNSQPDRERRALAEALDDGRRRLAHSRQSPRPV